MTTPTPDASRARRPAFPTTRWSGILPGAGEGATPAVDFDVLARHYWQPVFGAVRASGRSVDDARDVTQAFFAWLLERGAVAHADPERGRFRAFLKTLLQRFLVSEHRRATAQKRGGGAPLVPLDEALLPDLGALRLEQRPPDEVLDALWRTALVQRATDALEDELRAAGRVVQFDVFRDYFNSPGELDYAAVAERYGLTKAQVSNALQRTKGRYRGLLRAAVRETVVDEDEFAAELRWLFGADA